ncbi:hypothetical protein EVAR_70882_1 [Eumeta japonica]|uniref:Uncharacterized protein n=1 Tax=Eumeta variegata TaxID=151549 RepID=A0A4C2AFZ1_EUMVA|nr:hypothetical protein EVAR_70882_1 [Eumeta japonica]
MFPTLSSFYEARDDTAMTSMRTTSKLRDPSNTRPRLPVMIGTVSPSSLYHQRRMIFTSAATHIGSSGRLGLWAEPRHYK